ncbi:lysophospholipid acyltransferase family protein [Paenibacillus koleovorans]|uniref:lysophospholipid acyltransferase family protein n=1 Tax=Paenibacillus koleovorans TaxID=121608 RepID=UPI000FDA5B00|nr:lysophospholipid acyltransferase family protein [Paenibacillus koleovorans]
MLYLFFRRLLRILFKMLYRLQVRGTEHIPRSGAVILCANHISLFDPPLVGTPIDRKVHYMAKEELFRIPVLGPMIRNLGAFPVKRGGVSKESIRLATQLLKDGQVLGIFPEGSRSNSGGMGKKGAASLAFKGDATVIPVAIIGKYKLFKPMKIVYGPPVDLSAFKENPSSESLELATERIMETIRAMVAVYGAKG